MDGTGSNTQTSHNSSSFKCYTKIHIIFKNEFIHSLLYKRSKEGAIEMFRIFQKCNYRLLFDLVYFTTRVADKSDTSATRTTRVQHEWDTSDTSATRVRKFDFDNDTSQNIFPYPYIRYMVNERVQWEDQFHSENYLLEMLRKVTH